MALIDALMAGQQFVSGIQQQQQMAREYRDRMAMLARDEERAMRQEEREIARDIRDDEFGDFQRGLMEADEARKQQQFESTMESLDWARINRDEVLQRERDLHEANLRDIDQRYRMGEIQYNEYTEAKNLEKKADPLRSRVIEFQMRAAKNPSSITPEMLSTLEQDILNFMGSSSGASRLMFPVYDTFTRTAQFARDNGATLIQPNAVTNAVARQKIGELNRAITSPGREAGKIGSGTRFFFTGPDLRGGMLTREFGGREMVPSGTYRSAVQEIESKKDPVGQLLGGASLLKSLLSPPPDPAVFQLLNE